MNDFKPSVLSDVLLTEFVLKKEENERFKVEPHWKSFEGFNDYVILYKIALVFISLLNIERKNPLYFKVRLIFEEAIFTNENIRKLHSIRQVKSAMDKLGELIESNSHRLDTLIDQNSKIPWTMACLRAAGILKEDQAILHSRSSVIGMGWAMAWLKEAGIIETNPVTLAKLSYMWIDNHLIINNYLNECNPIL